MEILRNNMILRLKEKWIVYVCNH